MSFPQDGVCNDCLYFKGDFKTENEADHCKLTRPSPNKKAGECGANGKVGFVP